MGELKLHVGQPGPPLIATPPSFTWHTMKLKGGPIQEVDLYESLEEALEGMSHLAFEADDNKLVDWLSDGEKVVAVAIFAGKELLVTCSDGRQLRYENPEVDDDREAGGR